MSEYSKDTLKELLMGLAKDEIRVSYHTAEESVPACGSKIGGKPAVPEGFVWPRYLGTTYDDITKERPLSFMAQINLEEAAGCDTKGLLPKTGILSFFYEQMSMPWGFSTKDKGAARVYYFPETEQLMPVDIPEDMDDEAIMPELALAFGRHISLPEITDFPEDITEMDFEYDDYEECRRECGYTCDEWGDVTKLLGYPDTIQNSMEDECESLLRGYSRGCPEDFAKIPKDVLEDIYEKSRDWMLLFQMGTVEGEDFEYMFGDCGHIYFWIRRQDLENLDFDKVWLILQCS